MYAGFNQQSNIENKGYIATANLFCFRSTAEKVGMFETRLLSGGDSEWSWRAAKLGCALVYAEGVLVRHPCRTTLNSLVIQARRVAGGRAQLALIGTNVDRSVVATNHVIGPSLFSILQSLYETKELSVAHKFQVLVVGALVKLATVREKLLLKLGGRAERR